MGLFEELKRRNVIRVGAAYLLLAWVLIQVTDTVGPVLHLPEWTLALVTWMSIIGLPIAIFFAWAFELTPDGLKREAEVDRSESITDKTGRKLNVVVIGLLVIAVLFLLGDRFFAGGEGPVDVVADTAPAEVTTTEAGYDSIGVLPFVNMSDDPSQEYFSDGIAEELLNALAKLKDLQVAARTSSFAFKGQNQDISAIGKQLKVDTVLEGSVRKSGSRLRITAQLIDVDNGYHLWSETYDREMTDIFAIQDEITAAIVGALLVHFETGEEVSAPKTEVTNMSAYDAYLQGRHKLRDATEPSPREALALFRAATDADPEFAPAWAARAMTVIMLRADHFQEGIPREESHLLARNNIEKALAIDPNLAEAYIAESFLLADEYRYAEALESLEKAVGINANLAEAWMWRSRLLGRFGRIREARENILKAIRLDPHNPTPSFIAANLVDEFYEPEFLAKVERSAMLIPRIRQQLTQTRLDYSGPVSTEIFQLSVENNPGFPAWEAGQKFGWLKEIDEEALITRTRNPGDFLMWIYMGIDEWDKAQAMYDELPPERQQSVLNLEELSVMQVAQGKCEETLATLALAHGDEIRVHGEVSPNFSRSNSNLVLNRVHCLRKLGRDAETSEMLGELREYIETLRENTVYGIYVVDAKLRVLEGDIEGALATLESAHRRNELSWGRRYEPILRDLGSEPRFQALFTEIDTNIDAVRAELGMPPADI